jgi:hypothetical protein
MLRVTVEDSEKWLAKIRTAVKEGKDSSGRSIDTWELDSDGNFRHTGQKRQWISRFKIEPLTFPGEICFLYKHAEEADKPGTFAISQGRFLELLIRHFSCRRIDFVDKRTKGTG